MSVPAFMLEAPCARIDPELMFPNRGASERQIASAKSICIECPDRVRCLEYAIAPATRVPHGVMGGLTETERKKLIKKRRLGRAATYSYGPIPAAPRQKKRKPESGTYAPAA